MTTRIQPTGPPRFSGTYGQAWLIEPSIHQAQIGASVRGLIESFGRWYVLAARGLAVPGEPIPPNRKTYDAATHVVFYARVDPHQAMENFHESVGLVRLLDPPHVRQFHGITGGEIDILVMGLIAGILDNNLFCDADGFDPDHFEEILHVAVSAVRELGLAGAWCSSVH